MLSIYRDKKYSVLSLRLNIEKLMIMLIVLSFALTSINVTLRGFSTLTRAEATEISRNTWIVQRVFNRGHHVEYSLEAEYWSGTHILTLKKEHPNAEEWQNLPEDHGIWKIHWWISAPGYIIIHYIDEYTGRILFESCVGIG